MRPQIVTIFVFIVSLFSNFTASAQLASGDVPPPPSRTPPVDLPLDSAILLLITVGILYGIYIAVKRVKATNKPA